MDTAPEYETFDTIVLRNCLELKRKQLEEENAGKLFKLCLICERPLSSQEGGQEKMFSHMRKAKQKVLRFLHSDVCSRSSCSKLYHDDCFRC